MRFKGRPIQDCYVPRSGVTYTRLFEWSIAARWWGYKLEEFEVLDGNDQAFRIAVYRDHAMMESVLAYEHNRARGRPPGQGSG